MAGTTNEFYVPGSLSGSYVEQKRDAAGTKLYQGASNEIGIQKQAALQNLGEQYNQAINNAYASYLASQKGIAASAMGQGYKEAYEQKAQEAFQENVRQANLSAAEARSQVETSAAEQQSALQERYTTEVANLEKAAASMNDYLDYVRGLYQVDAQGNPVLDENKNNIGYLNADQLGLNVESLYDVLLDAQPQNYYDTTGKQAKAYTEWLRDKYGAGSKEDQAWLQYMYGGGLEDFRKAATPLSVERRGQAEKVETERKANLGYVGDVNKEDIKQEGMSSDIYITFNGKKYYAPRVNYQTIYEALELQAITAGTVDPLVGISPNFIDRAYDQAYKIYDEVERRAKELKENQVFEVAGIKFVKTGQGIKILKES